MNNEAVDHNDAGKNNQNGETDDVDENIIDSQNVALQIVHFLKSALFCKKKCTIEVHFLPH